MAVPFRYHWYDGFAPPLTGVALNVTSEPSHDELYNGLTVTIGATGFADIVISLLTATGVVIHPALLVISTVITSPSCNVPLVKVLLLVPTFVPLTFHWYDGLSPPLTGVAVNVTGVVTSHNEVDVAVIDTAGVTGSSSIVIVLLVTTGMAAHSALVVSVTDTTSPALRVLLENVLLFVPTFVPLTFHWYTGFVPPLILVAVNVIVALPQTEVELAVILTSGSTSGLTTTTTGLVVEQPAAEGGFWPAHKHPKDAFHRIYEGGYNRSIVDRYVVNGDCVFN